MGIMVMDISKIIDTLPKLWPKSVKRNGWFWVHTSHTLILDYYTATGPSNLAEHYLKVPRVYTVVCLTVFIFKGKIDQYSDQAQVTVYIEFLHKKQFFYWKHMTRGLQDLPWALLMCLLWKRNTSIECDILQVETQIKSNCCQLL